MSWPEKYWTKKNPFIEGLANYRDWMQTEFRFTTRNALPIFTVLVLFPAVVVMGGRATIGKKDEVFHRDFPHLAFKTVNQRRQEEQLKDEQEEREGAKGEEDQQ